jgi:CBS domain-containing protein
MQHVANAELWLLAAFEMLKLRTMEAPMTTLADIFETKGRTVHATRGEATVFHAVEEMCRHRIGALLVGEIGRPIGILSERDIMTRVILKGRDPKTTLVEAIMTRELVCADLADSPEEAMRVMTEQRCRHLPVVTDGRVVGVVSIGDLVRWMTQHQAFEIQWLSDYLVGRYPG